MQLSSAQVQQFKIDGYLVLPSLITTETLTTLNEIVKQHLVNRTEPYELEVDLQYPGAPPSQSSIGGSTLRRLKSAYTRDKAFAALAKNATIVSAVKQILTSGSVILNPNHHNCVMTKMPAFSSETLWHRDTRYWNFSDKYLVNAWFAFGDELVENGAMKILPGSHRWEVHEAALDKQQFLKPNHPDNQTRLATQRLVSLNAGDVLLFSAHCFHAAGKNKTSEPKYSAVFTYHGEATKPIEGSPSANNIEIELN